MPMRYSRPRGRSGVGLSFGTAEAVMTRLTARYGPDWEPGPGPGT